MADEEQQPTPPAPAPGPSDQPSAAAVSPAPVEGETAAEPSVTADALSDGTVPTVLGRSDGKGPKAPGGAKVGSLSRIYKRADIVSSALTLLGTLLVIGLVVGVYALINRPKPTTPPKVTTLSQADLTKLGAFFSGNNIGSSGQILTVTSSSLFKGRLAVDSDVKVTGSGDFTSGLSSGNLSVTGTTTLATVNVKAGLTVGGATVLQGPASLAGSATVGGSLSVSGGGSFGGAVSAGTINVATLDVSGTLNLAGHLAITGNSPGVQPGNGAGSGASAGVNGTDSAGTVSINSGTISISNPTNEIAVITFHTAYSKTPHVLITPVGLSSAGLPFYVQQTTTGFTISSALKPQAQGSYLTSNSSYAFNYWVIQ